MTPRDALRAAWDETRAMSQDNELRALREWREACRVHLKPFFEDYDALLKWKEHAMTALDIDGVQG